jgi:hypothetical protein
MVSMLVTYENPGLQFFASTLYALTKRFEKNLFAMKLVGGVNKGEYKNQYNRASRKNVKHPLQQC